MGWGFFLGGGRGWCLFLYIFEYCSKSIVSPKTCVGPTIQDLHGVRQDLHWTLKKVACPQFGFIRMDTWYIQLQLLSKSGTSSTKVLNAFSTNFQYTTVWLLNCNCTLLKTHMVDTKLHNERWSPSYLLLRLAREETGRR